MQNKQSNADNDNENDNDVNSAQANDYNFEENLGLSSGLSPKYLRVVKAVLSDELSQVFGYHALMYGPIAHYLCFDQLVIKNKLLLCEALSAKIIKRSSLTEHSPVDSEMIKPSVICDYSLLPFSSDSIDLAVLPNILQNTQRPQQLLREVERVLIPEGVVIIIGRNPLSFIGLKSAFKQQLSKLSQLMTSLGSVNVGQKTSRSDKYNKNIKTDLGRKRIADWFSLLGIEKQKQINLSITNQRVQLSHAYPWLKKCAQLFCDCFCSHYIIIGVKKVSTLTPIRPSWRSNKQLVPPRLAEPSVKVQVEHWFNKIKQNN